MDPLALAAVVGLVFAGKKLSDAKEEQAVMPSQPKPDQITKFDLVQYKNSGDGIVGRKDQVVGYCAIAVARTGQERKSNFTLSAGEKRQLLALARQTLEDRLSGHRAHTRKSVQLSHRGRVEIDHRRRHR